MKQLTINENNPNIIFAAYGSLRLNMPNYHYFLENKSVYLGTIQTEPNYSMWNLGAFPVISTGENSIVCDLFKISSNRVLQELFLLEGSSRELDNIHDFYQLKEIETEFGKAYIFWNPDFKESAEYLIKTGDWTKRPIINRNKLEKV